MEIMIKVIYLNQWKNMNFTYMHTINDMVCEIQYDTVSYTVTIMITGF